MARLVCIAIKRVAQHTLAMEIELEKGDIVDKRFEIVDVIGHGGMGTVYHAIQLSLGRPIALKVLRQDSNWNESRNFTKRFLQEASLTASLSHRNIVTVFDYGLDEEQDIHFIAMELIHGETLWDRLHNV